MDKENVSPQHSEEPVKKKPRLSLSLLKKRRFGESVSGNLHDLTKPMVPEETLHTFRNVGYECSHQLKKFLEVRN